jgi:hypothetical protein
VSIFFKASPSLQANLQCKLLKRLSVMKTSLFNDASSVFGGLQHAKMS